MELIQNVAFARVISVQIKSFPLVAQKNKSKTLIRNKFIRELSEVKSVILE